MNYLDPITQRWEYEERVRWLQRLHGGHSDEPGRLSHLTSRLLLTVGRQLVSLGERMQSQDAVPAATPRYETDGC